MSKIVIAKLSQNRRLVIPDLGVFIEREDGRILFSELMRTDDGVFHSAVAAERGVSEGEAQRMIERFVADIHHSLEHGMSYRLEGLGVLSRDERGLVVFRSRAEEEQRRASERSGRDRLARILAESAEEPQKEPQKEPQEELQKESQKELQKEPEVELMPQPEAAVVPDAEAEESAEREIQTAAKSYEKLYETAPAEEENDAPTASEEPARKARPQRKKQQGGMDIFLVIGITIAVIAIAAICYGLWVSSQRDDTMGGTDEPAVEQTESPSSSSADASSADAVIDLSVPSGKR